LTSEARQRINSDPESVERGLVSLVLMLLEEKMAELRDHFGLTPDDLNIDLGPLGPLLSTEP
jgi:Gas vesicle protein K